METKEYTMNTKCEAILCNIVSNLKENTSDGHDDSVGT